MVLSIERYFTNNYGDDMLPADVMLCDVNKVLGIVGISPFRQKQRMWNQTYVGDELQRVGGVLKKIVLFTVGHEERETKLVCYKFYH